MNMLRGTVAVAIAAVVLGPSVAGCHSSKQAAGSGTTSSVPAHSTTATSPTAQPTDYTALLIQASDINAPEVFTADAPVLNPNGQAGVAATFSNQDRSHVIYDTIQILADPAAATSALNKRKSALDGTVHGVPDPIDVGTGGTTVSGPSPDGAKGVTVLLFTQGRAFVELEFDGPPNGPAPADFVTDVGQKQDAAIKKGLAG
ncbi:hypothetical protein [Mycobacterium szulgai]|uniref:hypothetical protein n=1 Tax=Mycobacterium szulgai TaxID=1787 RepID=UPI0021F26534|nr:hypothetical protein [Mycobacterium szulgai]